MDNRAPQGASGSSWCKRIPHVLSDCVYSNELFYLEGWILLPLVPVRFKWTAVRTRAKQLPKKENFPAPSLTNDASIERKINRSRRLPSSICSLFYLFTTARTNQSMNQSHSHTFRWQDARNSIFVCIYVKVEWERENKSKKAQGTVLQWSPWYPFSCLCFFSKENNSRDKTVGQMKSEISFFK